MVNIRKVRQAIRTAYFKFKQFFHYYDIDCRVCGADVPWALDGIGRLGCCSQKCEDEFIEWVMKENGFTRGHL